MTSPVVTTCDDVSALACVSVKSVDHVDTIRPTTAMTQKGSSSFAKWERPRLPHLAKELLPFWVIAVVGLIVSTWSTDFTETHASALTSSHVVTTGLVMVASLAAYGG